MTSTRAITAQAVTTFLAIVGVATAAGLPLSADLTDRIVTLITVDLPIALAAISWMHHNHARIVAARETRSPS
jgi:predicted MFS family arabinose efflux permease